MGASDHGVDTPGGVGAPRQLRTGLELVGDRCGDQVDRSANRARPVLDLTRPLAHLYAVHPADDGEVIGRWRGIGSGRDEDSVLHESDLGGALRSRPAQADVGSQAEAFFLLDVDTGNTTEGLVHIVEGVPLRDLLADDDVNRAGNVVEVAAQLRPAAQHLYSRQANHPWLQGDVQNRFSPGSQFDRFPPHDASDHPNDDGVLASRQPAQLVAALPVGASPNIEWHDLDEGTRQRLP